MQPLFVKVLLNVSLPSFLLGALEDGLPIVLALILPLDCLLLEILKELYFSGKTQVPEFERQVFATTFSSERFPWFGFPEWWLASVWFGASGLFC